MKAIVQNGYGSPDVLQIKEVPQPVVDDDNVLVQAHATSINAGDYFSMKGSPWVIRFSVGFPKPKNYILGWDVAGVVKEVGKNVTRFKPGDEVFGGSDHTFAEYVIGGEDNFAHKPKNLTFQQAAAVPTAALTALQGFRDVGKLQEGQRVLINGASGGVGTFAVQIARSFGAEVTGVCGSGNVDMVRSIGADQVIDYTREDFTQSEQRFDLILDNVANRKLLDLRRILSPGGVILANSGHGGMSYVFKAFLLSLFMRQYGKLFVAKSNNKDLVFLKELLESGKITPVIDRGFPFNELPEAMGYAGQGHVSGKVVITMDHQNET